MYQFWYQGIVKTTVSGVLEDLIRLKFQEARTKIEVVLSLPCWLSQPSQYLDTLKSKKS